MSNVIGSFPVPPPTFNPGDFDPTNLDPDFNPFKGRWDCGSDGSSGGPIGRSPVLPRPEPRDPGCPIGGHHGPLGVDPRFADGADFSI
jgi:hypothetical protein